MASPCRVKDQPLPVPQNQPVPPQAVDPNHVEYDFVEQPSQDFFCPVTLELLINPHQTTCCGNHLSQEAVNRIQRDGKPCPMCNKPSLVTVKDLYYKRRVNEVKVRCPHKRNVGGSKIGSKNGCQWTGELGELDCHLNENPAEGKEREGCPYVKVQCIHCKVSFERRLLDTHPFDKCPKRSVQCPNKEKGCDWHGELRNLNQHIKRDCPMVEVECEFKDVGCNEPLLRKDVDTHCTSNVNKHMLLLLEKNREQAKENAFNAEQLQSHKNELARSQQEREILDRDFQAAKNKIEVLERNLQLKASSHETNVLLLTLIVVLVAVLAPLYWYQYNTTQNVEKLQTSTEERITSLDQFHTKERNQLLLDVAFAFDNDGWPLRRYRELQGFTYHEFTLREFRKYQAKGGYGDWFSEPFYSPPQGYKFQLNIETIGEVKVRDTYISVRLYPLDGNYDDKLTWPVNVTAHIQLMNQLRDHNHHEMTSTITYKKGQRGEDHDSVWIERYIKLSDLHLKPFRNIQYLRNDCLQFRVYFKATPA